MASPPIIAADVCTSAIGVGSACTNGDAYAVRTFDGTNAELPEIICAFAQEYSTFYNAEAGSVYQFTADNDVWITIRSGTPDGLVLAYGYSPQIAFPDADGDLFMHYNDGPNCETTNAYCIDATAQCTSCPPYLQPNDDPEDAFPIECGETFIGSNLYATESGFPNQSCVGGGGIHDDVFYSFTAVPGVNYQILVNGIDDGTDYDGVLTVYSGTLGDDLVEIACSDIIGNGEEEEINITVNEATDLLIRTFDWFGNAGSFEISMNCTNINNGPCEAELLTCGSTIQGTTFNANPSGIIAGTCSDGTSPSVFYEIDAEIGYLYEVLVIGDINFDPVIALYSSNTTCEDVLTYVICADFEDGNWTNEGMAIFSSADDTKFLEIFDANGIQGDFEISFTCSLIYDCQVLNANFGDPCDDGNPNTENDVITPDCECEGTLPPPPANDLCSNAQELVVNQPDECPANQVIGTTIGASDETGEYSCDTGDFTWADVFYTFNSGPYNTVMIDTELFTQTDIIVSVSQLCDGESIACRIGGLIEPVGVEPNTDYIIRTGPNFTFGEAGTFGICISGAFDCPALSANIGDACDDGDASTINDEVTPDCICAGEPAGAATFSGTTDWTSGCTFRPMAISLYNAGTDVHVATISFNINSAGTFSIPMDFLGTFDVYIKINGYLRKGFYNYDMAPGDNTLDMGALTPGDLNGDNGVNIADVSVMNIAFGSVQADDNYNLLADLNCDGGVNIVDVSALNLSFGMVGVPLP